MQEKVDFTKNIIIGTAKTSTIFILSLIPYTVLAAFLPMKNVPALVYVFVIANRYARTAESDLRWCTEAGTVMPSMQFGRAEWFATASLASLAWFGVEIVCSDAVYTLVFYPFLGYLFLQTIVDVVFLCVVASMEGMTYDCFVAHLKYMARDVSAAIDELRVFKSDEKNE